MNLVITTPPKYNIERHYIISVIMGEFLGLPYEIKIHDEDNVSLTADDDKMLIMPDVFFQMPDCDWLKPSTMPRLPLYNLDTREFGFDCCTVTPIIPIIYGRKDEKVSTYKSKILKIPIDIFGSCFFMLSRYEESVLPDRDCYDRFPTTASIASQACFLDRPIVDEYVDILWAAMKQVWPGLKRKQYHPRTRVTCDVDCPYSQNVKSLRMTLINMAGDLIKRKSAVKALRTGLNTFCSFFGYYRFDPISTFDWIMDVNERAGNRVAFYFFADHSADEMDGVYSIYEPRMRTLMRHIHARGHEIGLHASYSTYRDDAQIAKEVRILREVMAAEGINQAEIGNRQHYLRWNTPETARNLEKAGINYDTTLGYADHPGFRCGTCLPYPMYDLFDRKPLRLRQYPLILMECSVIDDCYLGMGYTNKALDLMLTIKKRSMQFGGNFTLLWHNNSFGSEKARSLYRALVV